jgi:hypothetical protein
VQRPGTVVASFGAQAVAGALAMLHEEMRARRLTNPAGRLIVILRTWPAFEAVDDLGFLDELAAGEPAPVPERRQASWGDGRLDWVNRRKLELITTERLPVGAAYERAAAEWLARGGE